jgi:hypothetical protein
MWTRSERQLAVVLLAVGALLAAAGNAAHPYLAPGVTTEELLAVSASTGRWTLVHLALGIAAVCLAAGMALLDRRLEGTPGAAAGRVAVVFAVFGGVVLAVQVVGIDGTVIPALAEPVAAAPDDAALLAVAEALHSLDVALLGLAVALFIGATFLALGIALRQARLYPAWVAWTGITGGAAGIGIGTAMVLGVGEVITVVAFRVAALLVTLATFGLVFAMAKEPVAPATSTATRPAAPSG